jgi:acyl carrier protein
MFSEEKLRTVMGAILEVAPDGIGPGTSTDTVEGWDSLKHMRLVIALEEAFDVTIPDEEVATMTSYEIVKLVVAEQAGKS